MTTDEIQVSRDWQGNEIRCDTCRHRALAAEERCRPLRACVHDRYARRIDRFFAWNPLLANDYLAHPYFEARAIAARYADVFRLPLLLADPDETVRWNAVLRLPKRHLLFLRNDPHREVRIRVAARLAGADLKPMMADPDYYVRLVVARGVDPHLLPLMLRDPEPEVRRVVAGRIGADWLMPMAADADAGVRLTVARRLPAHQLAWLQRDPDWRVRFEVAGRLDTARLSEMQDDPDPLVRERVAERLRNPSAGAHGECARSA